MGISFQLAEEHPVVATEADLFAPRRHDDVENCVNFEGLRLEYLAHRVYFDDVNVAEVLAKDQELFFYSVVLVLEQLDVVDPLL